LLRGFSAYPTRALIGKGERLGRWAVAKRRPRRMRCERLGAAGEKMREGHRG
jgi:hypothetical protein